MKKCIDLTGQTFGRLLVTGKHHSKSNDGHTRWSCTCSCGTEKVIRLPEMYGLGYKHNNCFSGDTRFITDKGVKTLKDEVGNELNVLTRQGWNKADVRSFGVQPLLKVELSNGVRRKTIKATPDHRWYVPKYVSASQGVVEKTTSQLTAGERPLINYFTADIEFDRVGFQHGFTFGDGTLYGSVHSDSYSHTYAKAYFAEGKREAAEYFDAPLTEYGYIHGLPKHFKTLPKAGDVAYTLGFIAGLVASDGCVSKAGVSIANKDRGVIEVIADLCASVGILTNVKPEIIRSTGYKKDAHLSELSIPKDSFRFEWLVRTFHKERFGNKRTKAKAWRIDSITPVEAEEVFCVTVRDGPPEFTLEGNILTGNCIGCTKATGAGYRNKIRTDFPEKFWMMAGMSRALGVKMTRKGTERIYLDELEPGTGKYQEEPEIQCGIFCEMAQKECA